MRPLTRLLRYVKPYWFHILVASVLSMALVGLFDAFPPASDRSHPNRVLNPSSQWREFRCFRASHFALQLHWFVPEHFHNVWTMVAFALVVVHRPQRDLRLSRHLSGELCRLRHDHRPAQ